MDNEYKVGALCELIASSKNENKTKKGTYVYIIERNNNIIF